MTAVATPGHTSNHLCFAYGDALLTGDHVMGWSTTVVVPPDGDMAAYMASLDKLRQRGDRIYYPAHGPPVTNPQQYVRHLMGHRMQREKQILRLVAERARPIPGHRRQRLSRARPAAGGRGRRVGARASLDLERRGLVERQERHGQPPEQDRCASRLIVVALLLGVVVGVGAGIADRIFGGPDPETIASASLRIDARAEPADRLRCALCVGGQQPSKQQLGGLVSSERTLILPGDVRYELDLSKLQPKDVTWDGATHTLHVRCRKSRSPGPTSISTRSRNMAGAGCCRR